MAEVKWLITYGFVGIKQNDFNIEGGGLDICIRPLFSVGLLLTSGGLLTHVEKNGLEKSKQTQQT